MERRRGMPGGNGGACNVLSVCMSLSPVCVVGCKSPSFQTILFCSAIHTPAGLESTFPTLPLTGTEIVTLERGGGGLEEFVETAEETNV